MTKRSVSIFLMGVLVIFTMASSNVLACACCAEPGFYSVLTSTPDSYVVGLLGEMNFSADAELYMDAGGFEAIKGLKELEIDSDAGKDIGLNVVEAFLNRAWKLNISTDSGRKGTITLPLPAKVTKFKVDVHDTPENTETVLYKEFRFSGRVGRGSGMFMSANTKPTSYKLVLQGRGNVCDNSGDFTHWRLDITGPRADFALFGKLMPNS